MSILTLPRAGMPLDETGNKISAEWYRWAHDITERAGGVTGSSTTELTLSQFEDAGIEETKSALFRAIQDAGQVAYPMTISFDDLQLQIQALADALAELTKDVQALRQGTAI